MADGITIDILGNKALLDNLDKFGADLQEKAFSKLVDAGYMAYELIDAATPVLSGYLKSRNQIFVNREGSQADVTVSNDASYAIPVVLGHHTRSGSWVEPNDFMTPGFDEAGKWLQDELKGLI